MQTTVEAKRERRLHAAAPSERRRGGRPVDLVHLARYTLGDRGLEQEVLGLFVTQARLYLRRLQEATGDKPWRDAAHTLKGSARSIGAWRVAQAAEAAETLQGAALKAGREQALAAVRAAVEEACAYIVDLRADSR